MCQKNKKYEARIVVVVVVAVRVLAIVDALRNFARIGRNSSEIKEGIIGQGFCQDNGANPQNSRRTNPYYDICIRMF